MKKNLGQLLIENKLINEKTLDEALKRQVIFGGRLGTNLLEMGAITEVVLLKILAYQHNVPYAEPRLFENVSRETLDSVPRDLLIKHRIIPLVRERHRITLAMTDPHKLDIVDEVSFQTNMVIHPVLASEIRIAEALEKYYQIRREARFISVTQKLMDERTEIAQPAAEEAPPEEAGYMLLELGEEDIEPADPFDATQIDEALSGVNERDDVALTIIKAGLRFMDDVFMFIIKGDQAHGWMSGGSAKPVMDFGSIALPMDKRNILYEIAQSLTMQRFDGVEIFEKNQWIKVLSLKVPKEVVICPLVLKTHMVAVLLGFSFESPITEEEAAFLVRVMQKASVAFEILIVKSHIVMLESNLRSHISHIEAM